MPDRRQPSRKYTADRQIPGAFEGETVTRRRFMAGTAHIAGAIATAAIVLPALGFALGPMFEKHRSQLAGRRRASTTSRRDTTSRRSITIVAGIGEAGKSTVYVRKHNPPSTPSRATSTTSSSRSRRAACTSAARSASSQAAQRFICPCHGGVYDFRGKVDGGPPVRPLDRFYTRTRNGQVEIGPRFSVNTRARALLAARSRASRSTASASTSTPRARRCASSREPDPPCPDSSSPRRRKACTRAPKRPGEGNGTATATDAAKEARRHRRRLDRRAHLAVAAPPAG